MFLSDESTTFARKNGHIASLMKDSQIKGLFIVLITMAGLFSDTWQRRCVFGSKNTYGAVVTRFFGIAATMRPTGFKDR